MFEDGGMGKHGSVSSSSSFFFFHFHCRFNLDLGEVKRDKEMDQASFLFSQYQCCYSSKSLIIHIFISQLLHIKLKKNKNKPSSDLVTCC